MENKEASLSGGAAQVQAYIDRLQAMIFPTGGADLLYAYIALIALRNGIRPLLPPDAEEFAQLLASRFQAQIEGED